LIIVLRNANDPDPEPPEDPDDQVTTTHDDYLVDSTPDDAIDASSTAFTIMAKDARGVTATKAVTIVRNAPPTVATDNDGMVTAWNSGTIGTQAAKIADSLLEDNEKTNLARCTTFNVCTEPVGVGPPDSSVVADRFLDHQQDELTITVEGVPAGISVTPKGKTLDLEITGITSTWNLKGGTNGATPTDEPYTFYVVATDKQGLSAKREISVSVDAAPTGSIQMLNRTLKQSSAGTNGTGTVLVREAASHFTDDKRVAVEVEDDGVVTVPADSTVADVAFDSGVITVTPKNPGTVMIKVTASESNSAPAGYVGLGQFVSQTFMVTVTAD
jgi:hypothetical protein